MPDDPQDQNPHCDLPSIVQWLYLPFDEDDPGSIWPWIRSALTYRLLQPGRYDNANYPDLS